MMFLRKPGGESRWCSRGRCSSRRSQQPACKRVPCSCCDYTLIVLILVGLTISIIGRSTVMPRIWPDHTRHHHNVSGWRHSQGLSADKMHHDYNQDGGHHGKHGGGHKKDWNHYQETQCHVKHLMSMPETAGCVKNQHQEWAQDPAAVPPPPPSTGQNTQGGPPSPPPTLNSRPIIDKRSAPGGGDSDEEDHRSPPPPGGGPHHLSSMPGSPSKPCRQAPGSPGGSPSPVPMSAAAMSVAMQRASTFLAGDAGPAPKQQPAFPCFQVHVSYKMEGKYVEGKLFMDWKQAENFPDCFASSCGNWQQNVNHIRSKLADMQSKGKQRTPLTCYYSPAHPDQLVLMGPGLGYLLYSPYVHFIVCPSLFAILCFVILIIRRVYKRCRATFCPKVTNQAAPAPATDPEAYVVKVAPVDGQAAPLPEKKPLDEKEFNPEEAFPTAPSRAGSLVFTHGLDLPLYTEKESPRDLPPVYDTISVTSAMERAHELMKPNTPPPQYK